MSTSNASTTDPVKGLVARVRAALGWATGDRREQAKGELEELDAVGVDAKPGGSADEADVLDDAELDVRGDHGDLAPSAQQETTRSPERPPTGRLRSRAT